MPSVTLHVANAFSDEGRGGNPAGLVIDADPLSRDQKQRIAALAGFSETAFVSRSQVADFKLEFFTPSRQIAHCGHATIATFCILRELGRVDKPRSSKETIDGTRRILFEGDMAFMEQQAPRYSRLDAESRALLLRSLRLGSEKAFSAEPLVVNTGNSFLIAPFASPGEVASLDPDFDAVAALSESLDLIGYYAYAPSARDGFDAAARMFAPRYGIREESATGMAAGPLACYLFDRVGLEKAEFIVEQGTLMAPPSPSRLVARLQAGSGAIKNLMVGGRAVISKTMVVEFQ